MKKIFTCFTLMIASVGNAHVHLNRTQAIEAINAHIAMLKAKLNGNLAQEKQFNQMLSASKKGSEQQATLKQLDAIKNEIKKLQDALQISENSLKPLQSK